MPAFLNIITVTKDDLEGVEATIASTRKLRACSGVRQIIVDGSVEPLQRKVQELLVGEENVDYLWQKPNGIAHAFNQGISGSDAGWVWFLNGRDEAHPDLDAGLLLQILNASNSEIIICELDYMQSGLRHRHPPLWDLWPPLYWVPHPATIIKRRLFDQYGFFSQEFKIAMDGELWMRFFSKDISINMISIPIALYDQYGVSSDSQNVEREVDKIIVRYFGFLAKLWLKRGFRLIKGLMRYFFHKYVYR